jgi:hypothetical protein
MRIQSTDLIIVQGRVLDPIQSGQWIQIRIQNTDPDLGGKKLPTKVGENHEISCFEVLDVPF